MSFALTKQAILDRTQTLSRRKGWDYLKPGDIVWAVEKGMGLKAGEKLKYLALLKIVSNTKVVLNDYDSLTKEEVTREGFPKLEPWAFVFTYCVQMGVEPDEELNRIEFTYIPENQWQAEIHAEARRAASRQYIKIPARLQAVWQARLAARKRKGPKPKRDGKSRRLSNLAKLKLLREAMKRQIHYWNTGVSPTLAMEEAERVWEACKPSAINPCDLKSHGRRPNQ